MRPRSIERSAGHRVRVLHGDSGSDYLVILNEDDGDREWQTAEWTTGAGGLPSDLARQINNIRAKERYVTGVSFGAHGGWFVSGEKRDGSGGHGWWGGTGATSQIKEWFGTGLPLKVSFGDHDRYVLIQGQNGFAFNGIDDDLQSRIKRINKRKKVINFVRLFPNGGYFISDSEGTEWKGAGEHLSKELKDGGSDRILDVTLAGDGSWVVIRPNRFICSDGVNKKLTSLLARFFASHQSRQREREAAITEFEAREQKKKKEREAAERRAKEEREAAERRRKEEEARREAEERRKADEAKRRLNKESLMKEQRAEEERLSDIRSKRLRVGDRVTASGFSHHPGDTLIKKVGKGGIVELGTGYNYTSVVTIRDPRILTVFNEQEEEENAEVFNFLCMAADKYEAAVVAYHCQCHDGVCKCTKIFEAKFLPASEERPEGKAWLIGERVHVKGFTDATVVAQEYGKVFGNQTVRIKYDDGSAYYVHRDHLTEAGGREMTGANQSIVQARPLLEHRGEVQMFDEYKCAEKIDLQRLQQILADLRTDRSVRGSCVDSLDRKTNKTTHDMEALKKLQRCKVLEAIAVSLETLIRNLPSDDNGFVVHEVLYEHRDPSCRGRLFAIGGKIKVLDDKYPRTATLQGMHSDLRASLVGKFAHDIDCENSECRLVCSLASQLGLEQLVPVLFDYRDNRQEWLSRIARVHDVSESDAKRLTNIIISGGRYETWLRSAAASQASSPGSLGKQVKSFVFKLYAEIHAFRDQLLRHPRFRWTSMDREKLKAHGKSDGVIDSMLFPRIVFCCENEVLGILHRFFFDLGWRVRAKVFDGLVAEPGPDSSTDLNSIMRAAEKACLSRGWDVRLVEKPLHGKQDEPLQTVVDAREALQDFQQRVDSSNQLLAT